MRTGLLVASCGAAVLSASIASAQTKPMTVEEMHKLHRDSGAVMAVLDDPARDAYQKPHEVLAALALKDGERIADVGSGSGYFALRFARHVGSGRVYAVEVDPAMVLELNRRVRDAGLDNVQTVLAAPDDPLLRPGSIDRVFICDTWHHIDNHARYLSRLAEVLKPGGQVVVIDFQAKDTAIGPPMEMRTPREEVVKDFQQHGFRLATEHTFLPYQYFLVFTRDKKS